MQRLDARDAERVGRFLVEAEEIDGDEPFPPELLAALSRVVPCQVVLFNELDRLAQVDLGLTIYPAVEGAGVVTYWDIQHEHPICSYNEATGDWGAHKLTDFVTRRQLHRSRIYADWYRPNGTEHELAFGLDDDPPLTHTKCFVLSRPRGRNFSEIDRVVLDTLRPYLARRYRTSRARHRLHAFTALVERAGIPLIFLDGRVVRFATPAASRMLPLDSGGARLPEAILAWLDGSRRTGSHGELSYDADGRSLVVRLIDDGVLLLEERGLCSSLTSREREILGLVAEGKTNRQIAEELWVSTGTVRRHLENVYGKLGVHTRTAAVRAASHRL